MQRKFGRELQRDGLSWGFDADFQVESYLRHQGAALRRPLRRQLLPLHHQGDGLLRPGRQHGGRLGRRRFQARAKFLRVLLHLRLALPDPESRQIVRASTPGGRAAASPRSRADKGHDAFLIPGDRLKTLIRGFLERIHHETGP